jgi:hypothetical protein
MKEFNMKIDAPKNTFQLMVLGDMHIGDELCDLELIKETIDYIKKTKDCYCILNGDLINNALKTSKSDLYKETMSIADEQDLLIELLTPIKNKILLMATGNHERRTEITAGINPLKAVCYALGIKDKLVEESYVMTLEFGVAHGMKNLNNKYVIYGTHGGAGGGRMAGATANALQKMSQVLPNAVLYIHSHTHTTITYNDMIFLYDSKTNKVTEHQRTYHNANAFLKYGGYAEEKEYKPVDRTPSVLVVKAIRTKGEMKIKTDIVRI